LFEIIQRLRFNQAIVLVSAGAFAERFVGEQRVDTKHQWHAGITQAAKPFLTTIDGRRSWIVNAPCILTPERQADFNQNRGSARAVKIIMPRMILRESAELPQKIGVT